jgi:hypothetical protein
MKFEFYGYSSPTDGTWNHDGTVYSYGEDYRTAARYREYLDCGMTLVLLQHENAYHGEPWETSNTRLCMDRALQAGGNKVVVSDRRLMEMCSQQKSLVGGGAQFKSVEALEKHIAKLIRPYVSHPAFYGIQMKDEPKVYDFLPFGQVYRVLRRLLPDAFLQCNLLPMGEPPSRHAVGADDLYKAYRLYLNDYLDATDGDSICFDEYPFRRDGIVHGYCLRSLQIAANTAKARKVQLRMVIQAFSMLNLKGQVTYRACLENDMYWQLNLLVGLGVRSFGYFTYFTKQANKSGNEIFLDGASFLNRDGTRSKMYGYMTRIHAEFQGFAAIAFSYAFNGMRVICDRSQPVPDYLDCVCDDDMAWIDSVKAADAPCVLTESKGAGFMYMLMNAADPYLNTPPAECVIQFKRELGYKIYHKGRLEASKTAKSLRYALRAGEAVYIIVEDRAPRPPWQFKEE